MIDEKDRQIIRNAIISGSPVPEDVADRLDRFLESEDAAGKAESETVCCKYWDRGRWRYKRISRNACDIAVGDVVDDSNCD